MHNYNICLDIAFGLMTIDFNRQDLPCPFPCLRKEEEEWKEVKQCSPNNQFSIKEQTLTDLNHPLV